LQDLNDLQYFAQVMHHGASSLRSKQRKPSYRKPWTAPRGVLRISLPIIGEPFLPVLADFKRHYPEVDLDLDFTERRVLSGRLAE
jgi:DNA-binding transcriptional LysR family regulator